MQPPRESWTGTVVALLSATAGLGGAALSLWNDVPKLGLALAAAVPFLPLVTTRPLSGARLLIAAAIWSSIGAWPGRAGAPQRTEPQPDNA